MKPTKTQNTKTPTSIGRSIDQQGDANLKSDGMANGSSQAAVKSKWAYNQHGGTAGGNYGRPAAATVGLTGKLMAGPKTPPTSSVPNFKAAMGANDKLNFGKQERTPSGTRAFAPSATKNYKGNPDMINSGRGPTKGNAQ